MIQFFCDGQLLYDPRNPDYAVYEPKCELEVNKTGSLTFTIPPTHPMYDALQKMKSEIEVYQDGEFLGAYRVLNTDLDFNNIKAVTCEGELAHLLDSVQRPAEYHDISVEDYFETLIHLLDTALRAGKRLLTSPPQKKSGRCTRTTSAVFHYRLPQKKPELTPTTALPSA